MCGFIINIFIALIPLAAVPVYLINSGFSGGAGLREISLYMAAGCLTMLPAAVVSVSVAPFAAAFGGLPAIFVSSFLVAAFIETAAKTALLKAIFHYRKETTFDEALVISIAAGTGFAFLENIMFSFDSSLLVAARNITAVPLHIVTTAIAGCYLSLREKDKNITILRGFSEPFLIHGTYDFLVSMGTAASLLALPLLAASFFRLSLLARKGKNEKTYTADAD